MKPAGEQLELFDLHEVEVAVPWSGRSPRDLTRVALRGIFKAQDAKSMSVFVDPAQCDLWPTVEEGPTRLYGGAPLLRRLPPGRRRYHGTR